MDKDQVKVPSSVSMPLVSICMPAYNAEKYIEEAIRSVLNQHFYELELVVVNDGSTDGTANVLAAINDPRLKVITTSNKGQCAAANLAFENSAAAFIKFMDADDLLSPDFIALQYAAVKNVENGVASASWGRFYNDDLTSFRLSENVISKTIPGHEWLVSAWRNGDAMMQCALWLIPRRILERSGLWDESLTLVNDFDFFTRVLLQAEQVIFVKDACLYYRSGIAGSLSDHKSKQAIESAFTSIDKGTRNLLQVRKDDIARLSCANVWQEFVYSFYLLHPAIIKQAEEQIKVLGGSDLKFPSAGKTGLLLKFFHWKTAQYLKHLIRNKLKLQ